MTLVSRAVDDSGNLGAPAQPVTVTVGGGSTTCPCTIWPASAVPTNPSESDFAAVELGVKFRTSVAGVISGIRFYKGAQNSGVHVGNLWSATGTLLASATFTAESAQGWQQVTFGTPVPVTANTTYVASYHAPNGGYAGDNNYFSGAGVTSGPLQALADGVDGGNGVYRYGPSGFPTETWLSTNYWVDVVFVPSVVPPSGEAPILVITSAANPFSGYYAEILRTEGLNAFTTIDISQVTDAKLAAHDVVILGEVALTTAQVTMFTNWVNNGGNLIAMRPDKKLAPLLGLTDAGTTLSEAYLLVNTAAAPGAGIAADYTWTFTTGSASSGTDGWTFCASEGGVCAFTGNPGGALRRKRLLLLQDVVRRHGMHQCRVRRSDTWRGQRMCAQDGPAASEWTVCAPEGGVCAFTGTQEVRYGANGSYFFRTLSNGTACTNAVFGDPIVGVAKECALRTPTPASAWTFCASEGGTCAFAGTQEVRYGANGTFIYRTLSNGTACT